MSANHHQMKIRVVFSEVKITTVGKTLNEWAVVVVGVKENDGEKALFVQNADSNQYWKHACHVFAMKLEWAVKLHGKNEHDERKTTIKSRMVLSLELFECDVMWLGQWRCGMSCGCTSNFLSWNWEFRKSYLSICSALDSPPVNLHLWCLPNGMSGHISHTSCYKHCVPFVCALLLWRILVENSVAFHSRCRFQRNNTQFDRYLL